MREYILVPKGDEEIINFLEEIIKKTKKLDEVVGGLKKRFNFNPLHPTADIRKVEKAKGKGWGIYEVLGGRLYKIN